MKSNKPKQAKQDIPLKVAISRTYSEGAKVNIGNYQSRDFFASATRLVELPDLATANERNAESALLWNTVKLEVKLALQAEVEAASDTKPAMPSALNEKFNPEGKRNVPWAKFQPREYSEEEEDELK